MSTVPVRLRPLSSSRKDTAFASKEIQLGIKTLKRADTARMIAQHSRILRVYADLVRLRIRGNATGIKEMEKRILELRKEFPSDPRLCLMLAYHYQSFQKPAKTNAQAGKLTNEAMDLFEKERSQDYEPKWGRAWARRLKMSSRERALTK